MARVCVIDIAGLSLRLLARNKGLWVNGLPSRPVAMAATFPALTASVQASMTTGSQSGRHGVIGGGIFRRQACAVSFAERSNTLLNKKRFWHARRLPYRPTVAMVFWSNPLAGAADVVVGASACAAAEGQVPDQPVGLYQELARQIGPLDQSLLHGPASSWRACEWIAAAAAHIWRTRRPDLAWAYMPGLDFELVRHGDDSQQARDALRAVDHLASRLAEAVASEGGKTVVLSDGGYVGVRRTAAPNVLLRRAGLLTLRQSPLGACIDLANSKAFVMADHQIAHVFCADDRAAGRAVEALSADAAVAAIVPREELFCPGLGRDRAGERVALAAPDAWFEYRWWYDDEPTPAAARRVDATCKCGYDPCELLAGERLRERSTPMRHACGAAGA